MSKRSVRFIDICLVGKRVDADGKFSHDVSHHRFEADQKCPTRCVVATVTSENTEIEFDSVSLLKDIIIIFCQCWLHILEGTDKIVQLSSDHRLDKATLVLTLKLSSRVVYLLCLDTINKFLPILGLMQNP